MAMFRKASYSPSSTTGNGARNMHDGQDHAPSPLSCLIYYAAVAQGASILSEYTIEENTSLSHLAVSCLQNVPALHSRFSHTANQLRFTCLLDNAATYCAITDEALCKEEVYNFLGKTRDAFNCFGKGRGVSFTLGAYLLDGAMVSIMTDLAASFVGIPRKEKENSRSHAEPPAALHRSVVDLPISSSSSAASPFESSCQRLASESVEPHSGYKAPQWPISNNGNREKKKFREQVKAHTETKERKPFRNINDLRNAVDGGFPPSPEKNSSIDDQKICRRKVSCVPHWIYPLA
ncbi:hypothetical protein KP509_10G013100 [Ceratopteris richardii]|uniref:Uncharacterized protein n=1 Tax=Ceratopteris richardii TaxID=49495 RepID=A0A8T2TV14_CERRI|nr:hypothetical protein KP509_10G013100 [Ceratopteris richardii]